MARKQAEPAAPAVRDRVRELRRVRAGDLLPDPRNWRRHPDNQRSALRAVLAEIGYADALLAREVPEGLKLIDGHLRRDTTPDSVVPVLVLDVDEAEAAKLLATLDPLAGLATADAAALDALLRQVQTGDAALAEMLAKLAKNNGLIPPGVEVPTPPPQAEPPLLSECLVEIRCTARALDDMRPTLLEWSERDGVTVDIS
jgi:hypothetical protein